VNPNRRVPEGPPFGEAAMAELLGKLLSSWGAKITVQEISAGRPNFIATFEGRGAQRSLMLEAHSDTVSVDGMAIPPFEPTVRDGRLYGRGACDTKGSMAAMLLGIREVLERDSKLPVTLHFVSTCNEELGATGAHELMKRGFRVDAAVVGEPTDLAIVHAHKGALRFRIQTHGVAAHSSDPSRGVNAISQMRAVLEALELRVIPSLAQTKHPLLGSPTLSVGTIHGGTQVNVIPALCEIEVDRRLVPGESRDAARAQIVRELTALKQKDANFEFECEGIEYYPPLEQDKESAVARLVAVACRKVLGDARFTTAPWGANSGVFGQAGIPCVLFGPGSVAQAHTKDEFIELEQVVKAAQVYAEIIGRSGGL
jgi:acetylornithine deacetylase